MRKLFALTIEYRQARYRCAQTRTSAWGSFQNDWQSCILVTATLKRGRERGIKKLWNCLSGFGNRFVEFL